MAAEQLSLDRLPELTHTPVLADEKDEDALAVARTVAFPNEHHDVNEEKLHHAHLRPRGVEMKREMTKEDKELAAAGYEHLEEQKARGKDADLDKVDITEHRLPFAELGKALETNIDPKEPGSSYGLTSEEAKERLARYGSNVLTPPKKKSALRKVRTTLGPYL